MLSKFIITIAFGFAILSWCVSTVAQSVAAAGTAVILMSVLFFLTKPKEPNA